MKSGFIGLLLSSVFFAPLAVAAPPANMTCHAPKPLPHGTLVLRHVIPQTDNVEIPAELADLTGSGIAELVQPGSRGALFELATVSARERVGADGYRTRATLAFPGERILAVKTVDGSLVGIDEPRVVLVASMVPQAPSSMRLRYVRGSNWKIERECDLESPVAYARFAEVTAGGEPALYVLDQTGISLYSPVSGSLIRTIDLYGRQFAIGQLDADAAMEIVAEGTPGVVVDAVSGDVEDSYAPGFGRRIAMGRAIGGGHWIATTAPASQVVTIYSTAPVAATWTIPQQVWTSEPRQLAAYDANGDGADDLLVGGRFVVGPLQSALEVRFYDIATQAVIGAEPLQPYGDLTNLTAVTGRSQGSPEVAVTFAGYTPGYTLATFTHPFGTPDGGEQNWAQDGPFSAFAADDFNGDSLDDIAYGGPYNSGPALGGPLHVLAGADWSSVWSMPTAHSIYTRFPQMHDLGSVRSPYGPGRLLITSGMSWYGSLAAIDGVDHSLRWIVGNVNGTPQPMGFREAQRLAVGDTDGDGDEEILVAANSTESLHYPGFRLHLFDTMGTEFWRSQVLPAQGEVNALKLFSAGEGRAALALVSTNVSTLAFELPGEAPVWTVADAALGAHRLQAGGYAILHGDCSVERLDAERQRLWRKPVQVDCNAIHEPIPGAPLLVATGRTVRWIDADSGAQVGVSAQLMPRIASGNRWTVVPAADERHVVVTAGGNWGLMEAQVAVPSADTIFVDTLE